MEETIDKPDNQKEYSNWKTAHGVLIILNTFYLMFIFIVLMLNSLYNNDRALNFEGGYSGMSFYINGVIICVGLAFGFYLYVKKKWKSGIIFLSLNLILHILLVSL